MKQKPISIIYSQAKFNTILMLSFSWVGQMLLYNLITKYKSNKLFLLQFITFLGCYHSKLMNCQACCLVSSTKIRRHLHSQLNFIKEEHIQQQSMGHQTDKDVITITLLHTIAHYAFSFLFTRIRHFKFDIFIEHHVYTQNISNPRVN